MIYLIYCIAYVMSSSLLPASTEFHHLWNFGRSCPGSSKQIKHLWLFLPDISLCEKNLLALPTLGKYFLSNICTERAGGKQLSNYHHY